MLRIRKSQWQLFSVMVREDFSRRACTYLKAKHPVQLEGVDDRALDVLVSEGIERAAEFHITRQSHVVDFLGLYVQHGPALEELVATNPLREILADESVRPGVKLLQLRSHLGEMREPS